MKGSGGTERDGQGAGRAGSAEIYQQGMAALLADVLSSGRPKPELLVRYACDPRELSGRARAEVERYAAGVVGARAELAVLRSLVAARETREECS